MAGFSLKEELSCLLNRLTHLPPQHEILRTKAPTQGDYSSNLPFLLSQELRGPPEAIGESLCRRLASCPQLERVAVGGKGFLNFTLSWEFLHDGLKQVSTPQYRYPNLGQGKRVLLEFVSANPTGPLNLVNARAAALGGALLNLLKRLGFEVKSEYYINDTGTQVELLLRSLISRLAQLRGEEVDPRSLPYPGEYLLEIAQEIAGENLPESAYREYLLNRIVSEQRESLRRFGVEFDRWVRESEIRQDIPQVLEELRRSDSSYEQDGAVWFRAKRFGDTQDRVLVRQTGEPTYFLADLAYHRNKLQRGFEHLIDILGPDHHGDIPRLKGGVEALGFDPERLEILIAQQTSLIERGERRSMSKRAGEYITLNYLLSEIGADALKFFLLMRKPSQGLEFDPELAKRAERANPVYYVQYAHARTCQILGFAKTEGVDPNPAEVRRLRTWEERELIKRILEFPDVVVVAGIKREPHHLVYQLIDLATRFHYFYERHRVVGEDQKLSSARLYLVQAVKIWLKEGLELIGVSAPERM